MSTAQLRVSLALWRRRHAYRQRRLDAAHARNDRSAIDKWHALLLEAGAQVHHRQAQLIEKTTTPRQRIVSVARAAAANYRRNPGAYHYLAGGTPNTTIMTPTPRGWRSDCSQFAVNVYREAGVKCPGTGSYLYSNTISIAAGGRVTTRPKPGDLGLYGSRNAPHHVEVYVGDGAFIGHGSQPIDALTPGLPSFYLSFID
jgi:cell wall-associated NlpC family hydrolase